VTVKNEVGGDRVIGPRRELAGSDRVELVRV